jgi:hypothetical protein
MNASMLSEWQQDPYAFLELKKYERSRRSPLRYLLPLDDKFLSDVARAVQKASQLSYRIGQEWLPKNAQTIAMKEEADDHWATIDDLEPLNNVCTKWCTRKYFPTAVARVNMVANVTRLYERLRVLTDLRFRIVFKGGVMIRLVLMECFSDLSAETRATLLAYMAEHKALSVSDFDFEIVAANHDPSPTHVHRFFAMDYAVLLWLQQAMAREVHRAPSSTTTASDGLLSLGWDVDEGARELRAALQTEVDTLTDPSAHFYKATIDHVVIGDGTLPPQAKGAPPHRTAPKGYVTKSGKSAPAPRKNVMIFDCQDAKCVWSASDAFAALNVRDVPSQSGGARFYATLNTYIGEEKAVKSTPSKPRAAEWRGLFHLARIKHAFVVYYTTKDKKKQCERLGGEMIDLSQSHGTSRDVKRRNLYEAVQSPYRDYPILGVDPELVQLRSYTIEGFLQDHMTMIFHTENAPWAVTKGSKRMLRYVSFLVAHVMGPHTPGAAEAKRRAVRHAADELHRLAGGRSDGRASSRRTGVRPIDAFLVKVWTALDARETGTVAAKRAFVRTLHEHLATLATALETSARDRWRRPLTLLDVTQFTHLHTHVRN